MSVFVRNVFNHHSCSSIQFDILILNNESFALLEAHWLSISHNFPLWLAKKLVVLIIFIELWWTRGQIWRSWVLIGYWESIRCAVSLFSDNLQAHFHKLILYSFFRLGLLRILRWVTFLRVWFLPSWIIYIDINIIVLHDDNSLIKSVGTR